MLIKSFCVGNKEKSFYIDSFRDGINIIHSDDNDKGKTIVSQGIMYSLGNTPCFPSGFDDFKEYYFITEIEHKGKTFLICRKKDFVLVKHEDILYSFNSINEFKRFFSKYIISLPVFKRDETDSIVGLELFLEMLFMPQDNRLTANIFNRGRYNKDDYIEMLFILNGAVDETDNIDSDLLKDQIKSLNQRRKVALNSLRIIKSKNLEAKYSSYAITKEIVDNKIKTLEKLQREFTELINRKNRLINRKSRNEVLLKEINSLNKHYDEGKLVCLNCGSDSIAYETTDPKIKFEVTDLDTRNGIRKIIEERISVLLDDIYDLDIRINNKRNQINVLMKDESLNIENYLFYKNEVLTAQKYDYEIIEIDKSIKELKDKLAKNERVNNKIKVTKKEILDRFVNLMNEFYKIINPEDPLVITSPFTKNDVNYSGSQGVLFIMSRYYAIVKMMGWDLPLVIDDFRDGEISTLKETRILEELKKLNVQILLTCTLKDEEDVKYSNMEFVNDISFNNIEKFHLMDKSYNSKFQKKLSKFNIDLSIQTFN